MLTRDGLRDRLDDFDRGSGWATATGPNSASRSRSPAVLPGRRAVTGSRQAARRVLRRRDGNVLQGIHWPARATKRPPTPSPNGGPTATTTPRRPPSTTTCRRTRGRRHAGGVPGPIRAIRRNRRRRRSLRFLPRAAEPRRRRRDDGRTRARVTARRIFLPFWHLRRRMANSTDDGPVDGVVRCNVCGRKFDDHDALEHHVRDQDSSGRPGTVRSLPSQDRRPTRRGVQSWIEPPDGRRGRRIALLDGLRASRANARPSEVSALSRNRLRGRRSPTRKRRARRRRDGRPGTPRGRRR